MKYKKFVAIAPKGQEFFYKRNSMISVPEKSAQAIADVLTANRYMIKDGEIWHVYENDAYIDQFISKQIKGYRKGRNLKVYSYYG